MLHKISPFQPSKTEFKFFILYTLLIIYGSLYPFHFRPQTLFQDLHRHILVIQSLDLGDMGINLVLFMPFGFLGVRSMRSPFRPLAYCFIVTLLSIIPAFGLQYLQIMIPGRVPCLMDIFLNILGCALAAYLGAAHRFRFFWGKRGVEHWKSAPLLLALCWPAFLLAPFVPSLDVGIIKNSLKPLLLHPEFTYLSAMLHLTGWTVFAQVLSEHIDKHLRTRQLTLIMLAACCAQVPIVDNAITLPHVSGALGALLLWRLLRQGSEQARIKLLFGLLLFTVSLRGLAPFELSQTADMDFHWLPFFGFLDGSRLVNVHMLFLKMFCYGSIIWLLERAGASSGKAALLCLVWIALIEVAQLNYTAHTPELTDMIIVLGMALWIRLYGQGEALPQTDYSGPERRSAGSLAR